MSHLKYHNKLIELSNVFYESHCELITSICIELEQPDKIKELQGVVKEQIKRGDILTKHIQKLSLIEENQLPIKKEDLSQHLENSIKFLKTSFPNRNIKISTEITQETILVKVNDFISDVLENILFNAVKHNSSIIAEIKIIGSKSEIEGIRYFKLEFQDNGNGITDKRKSLIFQRERRLGEDTSGMGLGLSLVKKIINNLG